MAIDPYGPCPCGSGKKIKFCCGDLATDIDRVVRMISGEQRIAAMSLLNRLLAKYPDRIALLDLKSGLAMSLGQTEEARNAIDRILAVQPENPHALARRAIFLARAEQPLEAVASLQEAVRPLQGEIPHAVLEAFLHVGLALHDAGHILAAKAHFQVHMRAQPVDTEDHRAVTALVQLHQHAGLPLLVRDDLRLLPCSADEDWSPDFQRACLAAAHGAWASAVEQLERLLPISENAPPVIYSLAVIHGWLGNTRKLVDLLRQFAQLDVPEDDAVEALALANVLDAGHAEDLIDRVQLVYELPDADRFIETLSSDRCVSRVLDDFEAAEGDDSPPPLACFVLLDRPMPPLSEDLEFEDVPLVGGLIQVLGRETDQAARMVFVAPRSNAWDETIRQLDAVTAEGRGDLQSEETVGALDRVYEAMSPRLRIPDGSSPQLQMRLMQAQQRHAIAQIWPVVSQHVLKGRTPDEATSDPSLRINLLSTILVFETTSLAQGAPEAVRELRDRIGLEPPAPIDPTTTKIHPWEIPLVRVLRLDLSKIDDDGLVALWRRSKFASAAHVTAHIAREVVQRTTLEEGQIDRFDVYHHLIRSARDLDDAKSIVAEARRATAGEEHADVTWDLFEFSFCLDVGATDDVNRLLNHFREEHPDDPLVAKALADLLAAHGIDVGAQDASLSEPAIAVADDDGGQTSRIWTPDSGRPVDGPTGKPASGEPRAIWTP